MEMTIKAILSRHGNDSIKAIVYCQDIAVRYPALAQEYNALAVAIAEKKGGYTR